MNNAAGEECGASSTVIIHFALSAVRDINAARLEGGAGTL
jgi:hypothetical protein